MVPTSKINHFGTNAINLIKLHNWWYEIKNIYNIKITHSSYEIRSVICFKIVV